MNLWTPEEDDKLRELYGSTLWADLLVALPGRNKTACFKRAFRLRVERVVKEDPLGYREALVKRFKEHPLRLGTGNKTVFVEGSEVKACTTCGANSPIEEFPRHESCAGGRRNICRRCGANAARKWKRANSDRAVAAARRWQRKNPEQFRLIKRAANNRRHKRIVEGKVSAKELRARWSEFFGLCGYCLSPATTDDHMQPLSRGGRHEIANIVPACRSCNFTKHNKTPLEFILQQRELRS